MAKKHESKQPNDPDYSDLIPYVQKFIRESVNLTYKGLMPADVSKSLEGMVDAASSIVTALGDKNPQALHTAATVIYARAADNAARKAGEGSLEHKYFSQLAKKAAKAAGLDPEDGDYGHSHGHGDGHPGPKGGQGPQYGAHGGQGSHGGHGGHDAHDSHDSHGDGHDSHARLTENRRKNLVIRVEDPKATLYDLVSVDEPIPTDGHGLPSLETFRKINDAQYLRTTDRAADCEGGRYLILVSPAGTKHTIILNDSREKALVMEAIALQGWRHDGFLVSSGRVSNKDGSTELGYRSSGLITIRDKVAYIWADHPHDYSTHDAISCFSSNMKSLGVKEIQIAPHPDSHDGETTVIKKM